MRQGERADRRVPGVQGAQLPRGFRESWRPPPLSWPLSRASGGGAQGATQREGPEPRDSEALWRTLQTGKKGEPGLLEHAGGGGWRGVAGECAEAASRSEQSQRGGGLEVWGGLASIPWPATARSRVSVLGG